MNGRTVFAVNRSPVLAWNVEPQTLPYADMPAAAAAAISPADPYARCWQNPVDAGSGFSYFGALYNNSLPPTAYRLQPGCMANLGQFWPPTPPPDGCGRYDGSNLYLGPHVYRHGENIPSNLRNSYQGLGHYSHVVEASKESNQRTFKRETPISPNVNTSNISNGSSVSKSENINTLCVNDSKLKPQVSISSILPKQEIVSASASSQEPYLCAPDSRSSSSMHPSNDKACFSPPYSLKNALSLQNHSQDTSVHKIKALTSMQDNCNASPLKNVYFSNIESENINSVLNKKFKSGEDHFRYEPKNIPLDMHKLRNSSNFMLHNPYATKKYDVPVSQEYCNVNTNCKLRTDKRTDSVVVVGEQQYKHKSNVCRVKPEKSAHSDCKYERSVKNQSIIHAQDYRTSSEVFNIPTSMMHSKLEPNEKYFLSNCSSTVPSCMANSFVSSGSYLLNKDFTPAYHNMIYPNSCSLSKPWHISELPAMSPDNYLKAPEAAKPPMTRPPFTTPAMHEELVSVAQTAPPDMDGIRIGSKMQQGSQPKGGQEHDDDDVQIISVQTKQPPTSKNSRHLPESKPVQSPPVSVVTPLCLTSEKEPKILEKEAQDALDCSIESNAQWIKSEPVPPVLEKEEPTDRTTSSQFDIKNEDSELDCALKEPPIIKCEVTDIKQEVTQTESSDDCDMPQIEQKVCKLEDTKTSDESAISLENFDDCSDTSKMPDLQKECCENVPTSDFNDNHNLNLLLNTIEKVASLENTCKAETTVKLEPVEDTESSIKCLKTKTCGLDLLSVIAGQRLESEFDSSDQNEDIKSNYPLISKDEPDESEKNEPKCELSPNSQKASVFEMQAKLAELQKKYKQKQKEVSRLKPKKRFTNMFFNGRKKEDHDASSEMNDSDLNGSAYSTSDDLQFLDEQSKNILASTSKVEAQNGEESNDSKRKVLRKRAAEESCPQPPEKQIRTRSSSRHTTKPAKSDNSKSNLENFSKMVKSSNGKGYQLRKVKSSGMSTSLDDDIQIISLDDNSSDKSKEQLKKLNNEEKKMKAYSLRCSGHINKKQETLITTGNAAVSLKSIASKRKSDNPKKYMPSKQGKLSETIIAKQLRNRILFDTSGSMSDDDAQDGGVPEELYDALMKCHLEDQSKKDRNATSLKSPENPLASTEPRRLKPENLVLQQRLLTLEDGLFYAGFIKEIQGSNRYGIMLDGRRGNRLQFYSQEELLTQAIVESKPLSSELPVGTRVCAFWSRDYWCMYPGIVGEASCPSHDWSEPRVFVLFDDGDTAQIATKNIRLIPPDVIPIENNDSDSPAEQTQNSSDNTSNLRNRSRRLRCSTSKTLSVKDCDISNENESKDSSCASVNDSSCDDSCFNEYSLSPSQNPDNFTRIENSTSGSFSNDTDTAKLEKRQKKRSKRKTSCRTKLKEDAKEKSEPKMKRHKKYKEKHHKHHHHHHHHHRHHHHHHHSKKHKHRRKNEKNSTSQNSDKANIIPYSVNHKPFKICQKDAEACTDHVGHSSTANLPQNDKDRIC